MIGKSHSSLYELKKEQGDSEAMLQELDLGHKVKKPKDTERAEIDELIYNIVRKYCGG